MIALDDIPATADPLMRDALRWVIRLHSGDATQDDALAIKEWRAQSPQHEQAFREAVLLWRSAGETAREMATGAAFPVEDKGPATNFVSRRGLIGGAIAASAAGYFVVKPPLELWPSLQELTADYRTAKGERKSVTFADNVALELNTQTSIAVRSSADRPRFELLSGEAAIVANRGAREPLTVVAAGGSTTARKANFNARCLDGIVSITCVEGVVDVDAAARNVRLTAGQQVTYSAAKGLEAQSQIDSAATAWVSGLLIVRDLPLAGVIDEVNRYRPGKIIVMNSRLGQRKITGTFHLDQLEGFVDQVRHLFQASVRSLPGGIVLLS